MSKAPTSRSKINLAKSNLPRKTNSDGERIFAAKEFFAQRTLRGNAKVKIGKHSVLLTNLDKVYFPKSGYTKGDVIRYYYTIARTIIPYLKDRPLILKRYPNGIDEMPFYQHNLEDSPDFQKTFEIASSDGKLKHYALVNDVAELIYLANLGTIAQNPFHTKTKDLLHPTYFIFDIDPGDKSDYKDVCTLALEVKKQMDGLDLNCYTKTSGSSGMHIYIPIKPVYGYDEIVEFTKAIARRVVEAHPKIATIERMTKKRKADQCYVDYLQNLNGKSIASAYSIREKPGATVSTPIEWSEVKKCVPISKFDLKNVPLRIERKGDIFNKVLTEKQSLKAAQKKLLGGSRFD